MKAKQDTNMFSFYHLCRVLTYKAPFGSLAQPLAVTMSVPHRNSRRGVSKHWP